MSEIKQVVNETDWMNAIYTYVEEQLNGRFRLQFPDMQEYIEELLEYMNSDICRKNHDSMLFGLNNAVATHGASLTFHSLTGCPHEKKHHFQREFINLIWSARHETVDWLNAKGIVPGQSCN